MKRWVAGIAVVIVFLVGCGESQAEKEQQQLEELEAFMDDLQQRADELQDSRDDAFLECLERANDNITWNDRPSWSPCRR